MQIFFDAKLITLEAASRQARVHLLKFTILSRTEREVHRRQDRRLARVEFPIRYRKRRQQPVLREGFRFEIFLSRVVPTKIRNIKIQHPIAPSLRSRLTTLRDLDEDGILDTITYGETNAMKIPPLIRSLLLGNPSWEQFSILLARVSLGIFFAISGGNKLLVPSRTRQMYETLTGAGIPFPHFMTYFVSSVELVSGCLLVIGMFTSLCCVALIIQMIVAIATVQLATIPKGVSALDWLDDFLYLPETLYIIILIWLICSGPGKVSVDDRIARALVSDR